MDTGLARSTRTPLREGLLSGSLDDLDKVRLTGTRCTACGEVSLGDRHLCPNCGGEAEEAASLSAEGTLWAFTVIRHRPPGDYAGKEPFEPFGLGLVELPEGLRVLSPVECAIADLKIGMRLSFRAYPRVSTDDERVLFTFVPA